MSLPANFAHLAIRPEEGLSDFLVLPNRVKRLQCLLDIMPLLAQQIAHILRDDLPLAFNLVFNNILLLRLLLVNLPLFLVTVVVLLVDHPIGQV